jgi:hypothetical protein
MKLKRSPLYTSEATLNRSKGLSRISDSKSCRIAGLPPMLILDEPLGGLRAARATFFCKRKGGGGKLIAFAGIHLNVKKGVPVIPELKVQGRKWVPKFSVVVPAAARTAKARRGSSLSLAGGQRISSAR